MQETVIFMVQKVGYGQIQEDHLGVKLSWY
jgi:hypothetical protein